MSRVRSLNRDAVNVTLRLPITTSFAAGFNTKELLKIGFSVSGRITHPARPNRDEMRAINSVVSQAILT